MNADAASFALRAELFGQAVEPSSQQQPGARLTTEQMAGFVDRVLSGKELLAVVDHLVDCEPCALAVDDLKAFKDQVAPSLERDYRPAAASPWAEGWWHRAAAYLLAPLRNSAGLAFGAAAAALLLAVTGWMIWRAPQDMGLRQEIAETPAAVPAPPTQPQPAPAPVTVVAQLNDGEGRLTLDREGRLSGADGLPAAYQGMLREALATRRIESSSQLKGLTRPASSLMGEGELASEFSVIEPVGKVVMSERPTFRWSAMEGAAGYVVEVYDSKFNLIATSPQLADRSWTPPQSLRRGGVYAWQVRAVKEGREYTSPRPPAQQAGFRILDEERAKEVAKARRAYASSHLALGLVYAEAGLLKEAEQELRLLQKANPESAIARNLVKQVQALRRRSD